MTLMRSHCLVLLTCMTVKSLSDVINDTLVNKMHELSVYSLFETIIPLLKSQYRIYKLFNSPEICNLTLYQPLRLVLASFIVIMLCVHFYAIHVQRNVRNYICNYTTFLTTLVYHMYRQCIDTIKHAIALS